MTVHSMLLLAFVAYIYVMAGAGRIRPDLAFHAGRRQGCQ